MSGIDWEAENAPLAASRNRDDFIVINGLTMWGPVLAKIRAARKFEIFKLRSRSIRIS